MGIIHCSALGMDVEVSENRLLHIEENHPDLLPEHRHLLELTITAPDLVRSSKRMLNAKLLSRWFPNLLDGKHIVAVIVCDVAEVYRNWLITAYITRSLPKGE